MVYASQFGRTTIKIEQHKKTFFFSEVNINHDPGHKIIKIEFNIDIRIFIKTEEFQNIELEKMCIGNNIRINIKICLTLYMNIRINLSEYIHEYGQSDFE